MRQMKQGNGLRGAASSGKAATFKKFRAFSCLFVVKKQEEIP